MKYETMILHKTDALELACLPLGSGAHVNPDCEGGVGVRVGGCMSNGAVAITTEAGSGTACMNHGENAYLNGDSGGDYQGCQSNGQIAKADTGMFFCFAQGLNQGINSCVEGHGAE